MVKAKYPLDMGKAMSKCTTLVTVPAMDAMKAKLPQMVGLFRAKGAVTEADMDELGERCFVR
jgi:hypothetical protein